MSIRRRKLVRYGLLKQLYHDMVQGVPIAYIIRKHQLNISTPHLNKLFGCYELALGNDTIKASLRPLWLDPLGNAVQCEPAGYRYVGRFPYGKWEQLAK
jgi:hypothetical protein